MMEKPNDSNYNRTFNFGESSDVKLSPTLNTQAAEIEEECDPLGQDANKSQQKDSDELGHLIAKVLRFHPFMRLFNVCATSMYLDKEKRRTYETFLESAPQIQKSMHDRRIRLHHAARRFNYPGHLLHHHEVFRNPNHMADCAAVSMPQLRIKQTPGARGIRRCRRLLR